MIAIFQTTLKIHFWDWKWLYFDTFSVFVRNSSVDNKSRLIQVMAWRRPGGKQLSNPVITQFKDTYMDQQL